MPYSDPRPKSRRRWWQFRLRTLLLLLTLIGVALALVAIPMAESYREQQIVAPIEAAGGQVNRRFVPRAGSSVLRGVLGSRPYLRVDSIACTAGVPVETLTRLKELRHLSSLALHGVLIPDEKVQDLAAIPLLQSLDLSGCAVTDAGLRHLRGHQHLTRLNVARTLISDTALVELEKTLYQAPHLLRQRAVDELLAAGCRVEPSGEPLAAGFSAVHLSMMDVRVTPDHFRHLGRLPGLRHLHISHGAFTEQLLATMAELPDLQTLHIQDGDFSGKHLELWRPPRKLRCLNLQQLAIDDEALRYIGRFSELQELHLDITQVTGLGLMHLQSLKHLEFLSLQGSQFLYDVDLEALRPLKALRALVVPDSRVTALGVARLNQALPALRVSGPAESRVSFAWGLPDETDAEARRAFWSGDYGALQRCFESATEPADWYVSTWLGHARQLAGDWPGAVAAYQEAIQRLNVAWSKSSDPRERDRLEKEWPILVLLAGRAQLELLNDPAAAIKTLGRGLDFAPAANRPVFVLAQEAAKRIGGLDRPHRTRPDIGRLGTDLMYPLTAHRHLAIAYEKAGDPVSALECWTRIRLCELAYQAAMAETDPVHLAKLWASLGETNRSPEMPVFTVVSGSEPTITLERDSAASRLTSWDRNAWDKFALVPSPGHAIASLSFEFPRDEQLAGSELLVCWAGADDPHDPRSRMLLDGSMAAGTATERIEVDVPFDGDVVFVSMTDLASVTLRATLRLRTGQNEDPNQGLIEPRRVLPQDVVAAASPFQALDNEPREPIRLSLGGTSMARLPDGRFVLAFGGGAIEIAMSQDGRTWDGPSPYPHNEIFPTRNPSLCVDDDGTIWMVYLSKRPTYEIYSSAPYFVYRSSSPDGHDWSRPKPISSSRVFQYQEVPALMRDRPGVFRLFVGDQSAVAASPDRFSPLQTVYVPVREDWRAQDVRAALDDQGRCHIVYGDSHGRLHYSYADADGIWQVSSRLKEIDREHLHTPQLILDGHRLALVYWASDGLWLHRGRLTPGGPKLGPAQQITNHRIDGRGAQLFRDGDDVYLPLPARPPLLLRAALDDLLGE